MSIPSGRDLLALGRQTYQSRCIGCHGPKGDGNGAAATFLSPKPRDFTSGVFKFRSTPSGSLPTDGDLYRTITRGVRWTAMPTWHELSDKERMAVAGYIKTFSSRFKEEAPEPPLLIGEPPKATAELVARGKELYVKAKCFQCHGPGGKGDGPSADEMKGPRRLPDPPRRLHPRPVHGRLERARHLPDDVARPRRHPDAVLRRLHDRAGALGHLVLVLWLSAWMDPLTGKRLEVPPATRALLNGRELEADHPRLAVDPAEPTRTAQPGRRLYPGIRE